MAEGITVHPALRYKDAKAAIALLKEAFGFTEVTVLENEDGTIAHAELAHGNGMVMLGTLKEGDESEYGRAVRALGTTQVYVVVDDPDAHHDRAVQYGVKVVMPLTDQDYGSRDYAARDLEGNIWHFGTYAPEPPKP